MVLVFKQHVLLDLAHKRPPLQPLGGIAEFDMSFRVSPRVYFFFLFRKVIPRFRGLAV